MGVADRIRRRIKAFESMKGKIEELQITKEEAEELVKELGSFKEFEGKKLIIVDELGDLSKKDCFAYIKKNGKARCYCLKQLYCKDEHICNFYRNDISIMDIEKSIEQYAINPTKKN